MLKVERIPAGMPGYWKKNENRYRYCDDFHNDGYRCTREKNHVGPHAAHIVMGVENTIDKEGNIIPGTQNTQYIQIATWDKENVNG